MTITKRDTIVLAVLLNLVVLVGVFVTARQVPFGEKKSGASSSFGSEEVKENDTQINAEESAALDEIDQLLEEYDSKGKPAEKAKEPERKAEQKVEQKNHISKKAPLIKEGFYVVRPGDNPWKIAKKFHISFEKLLELNKLDEAKAKNLKVGQTLRIKES